MSVHSFLTVAMLKLNLNPSAVPAAQDNPGEIYSGEDFATYKA